MERIQKLISASGYCSRRKAEELIESGKVLVCGKVAKLGDKAESYLDIKINDRIIKKQEKYYYILNKPKGILVTKSDPQNRKTIYDLDSLKKLENKIGIRLNYVGRLDAMSEGLLILTNDGELQNKLTHPTNHVEKTYLLRTEPKIRNEDIKKIQFGILLDKKKFFGKIKKQEGTEFEITIAEGRNRIIRRVMEKLDYKIFMLKRIQIGKLNLENLKEGEIKKISSDSI